MKLGSIGGVKKEHGSTVGFVCNPCNPLPLRPLHSEHLIMVFTLQYCIFYCFLLLGGVGWF